MTICDPLLKVDDQQAIQNVGELHQTNGACVEYYITQCSQGLPARIVLDTFVDEVGKEVVDLMTSEGIKAMKHTAKTFELQIYQLHKEATVRRAVLARKGSNTKFKLGDEVSLFLPPSEQEAKQVVDRKAKHLLFFREPVVITETLSNTT